MFEFSKFGIDNKDVYCRIYSDFIAWCKNQVKSGMFSTYTNGEPVCFSNGLEISYRIYLANR